MLAADIERARLLDEAETCPDPDRLGDVHDRLIAIDAYGAPARAARILLGLGFDEEMQGRPLDSYSGGWKMRVALAALLFSEPDLLLLDEPSNHLDLEATLWLENFLKAIRDAGRDQPRARPAQQCRRHHPPSRARKDHALSAAATTLRAAARRAAAQLAAARAAQDAQRAQLQDYIARNSARASTAKQAQSRAKMLAKMQPIAALAEDPACVRLSEPDGTAARR